MKKIMMVLMMVFGLSAVFADSYVAFTSKEEFEKYRDSNHSEWDASQKAFFEEATVDLSAKQKKRCSLIIVCSDNSDVIKNHILVYHFIYGTETYKVIVFDDNFNIIVDRQIYATEKQDLAQIGLSCIKEDITHVVNIDKGKVVFAVEKEKQQ